MVKFPDKWLNKLGIYLIESEGSKEDWVSDILCLNYECPLKDDKEEMI